MTGDDRSDPEEAINAQLQEIWSRFRGQMTERVESIEEALAALVEGRLDPELRERALRDAHRLAGSAGTFGRREASIIAGEFERIFEGHEIIDDASVTRALELVEDLRDSLDRGPVSDGSIPTDTRVIAVMHSKPGFRTALGLACEAAGFTWVAAKSSKALKEKLGSRSAAALVLELGSDKKALSGLARALTRLGKPRIVFAISDIERLKFRVRAMDAGVSGFLPATLGPEGIIAAVREALGNVPEVHQRILVIDDDPVIVASVRAILEASDFEVLVAQEVQQFWRLLNESNPDLVLLDLDIPDVRGDELCRLIRAEPRHRALPVIFLSASQDASTTELLFGAGADDFVKKPIVGPELVSRISGCLERNRALRDSRDSDALTGLQNRTSFEREWPHLVERATRDQQGLAYVLLGVDDLAGISDRFGHDFGDQVLRELALTLLANFQGAHLLSRWSPGQMALALYGFSGDEATERVSQLLEAFSSQSIAAPGGVRFRANCSAAVGELNVDGADLGELSHRAYQTLSSARDLGGGQVMRVIEDAHLEATRLSREILIVEDDDAVGELLEHGLRTRGYSCRRMTDGQTVVDDLTRPGQLRPALVILDVNLPGLDGFTVLEHFRRSGVLKTTKVIVLTARSSESEVVRALELGAFDHVTKPFSLPVLLQRVHRALGD